jgi:hypothetical protein
MRTKPSIRTIYLDNLEGNNRRDTLPDQTIRTSTAGLWEHNSLYLNFLKTQITLRNLFWATIWPIKNPSKSPFGYSVTKLYTTQMNKIYNI